MTTQQLLRFAIARPPLARRTFPHVLVGPFSTEPGTPFQQVLERSTAPAATAAEFMAGDAYVGRSLRRDPGTAAVLRALPELLVIARRHDHAALLAALGDLNPRSAGVLEIALWDSLIAAAAASRRPGQDMTDLSDALRIHTAAERAAAADPAPAERAAPDMAAVVAALTATVALPAWLFPHPVPGSPADRGVRPVGVTDLLLISERLVGYEHAQLSYVENVLRSEKKERTFRRLDRTYDSFTVSTETVEESQRDLQTTSRVDLQSEVSETATQEAALSTGVTISASYGPFLSADTSIEASTGTSVETATSMSESYAQDIVDRAVTRVSKSVRETAVQRVLAETEETSLHGFDNVAGTTDVVGYYRWLEQVWQAQVMNYGRRMLLEFMVPRPAALWLAARGSLLASTFTGQPPEPLDLSPEELNETSHRDWVVKYQVEGVTPPPSSQIFVTKTIEMPEMEHQKNLGGGDFAVLTKSDFLEVPPGYQAVQVFSEHSKQQWGTGAEQLRVHLGERILNQKTGDMDADLDGLTGRIDIVVFMYDYQAATIDLRLRCVRTVEAMGTWQLATYDTIAAAYRRQLDAYEAALDAYEAGVEQDRGAAQGTQVALSPDAKRKIELDELKRSALNILTGRDFSSFDAVTPPTTTEPLPVIDPAAALAEAGQVRLCEQGFEWTNAAYLFYPYFWANQDAWFTTLAETDPDPTFQAFLQSGYARLQVPVRPGFERALLWYLGTGDLWHGGEPPVLGDEFYLPIVEELAEAIGMSLDDAEPYGDPWTYRLPTTLVALDADVSDIGL